VDILAAGIPIIAIDETEILIQHIVNQVAKIVANIRTHA
jgi:hypothetical protein